MILAVKIRVPSPTAQIRLDILSPNLDSNKNSELFKKEWTSHQLQNLPLWRTRKVMFAVVVSGSKIALIVLSIAKTKTNVQVRGVWYYE